VEQFKKSDIFALHFAIVPRETLLKIA